MLREISGQLMDLEDWQRAKYWKADNQHVLSENYQQTEIGAGNCSQIHSVTHLKTLFVNTGNKEMAVNHLLCQKQSEANSTHFILYSMSLLYMTLKKEKLITIIWKLWLKRHKISKQGKGFKN